MLYKFPPNLHWQKFPLPRPSASEHSSTSPSLQMVLPALQNLCALKSSIPSSLQQLKMQLRWCKKRANQQYTLFWWYDNSDYCCY